MNRLTARDGASAYYPRCFKRCGGIGCVNSKCNEEFMGEVCQHLAAYEDTGLEPEDLMRAFDEDAVLKIASQFLHTTPDRLRQLAAADRGGMIVVIDEPVNISYKSERIADEGKTLKPLDKSALLQKRGMAVLVASLDGKPMLYGMDRVAAVIDTVPIYGESHMGIVAIYGRGLTLGDSDYGITWVAYDYNSSENPNSSVSHFVGVNTMDGKDEDNG